VHFRLFGAFEIYTDLDRLPLELGPPRQRALLAALAVDAGRVVPQDALIERVWGDAPPRRARDSLYVYIARLRRLLDGPGGGRQLLVRRSGGYLLDGGIATVDLYEFHALADAARKAECPDRQKAELLGRALALWRGPPLTDMSGGWADQVREAWHRRRIGVATEWAETLLRSGEPGAAIGPLTEMSAEYPLVESIAATLMLALHAEGRGAEALDCYFAIRRRLADELGTDPADDVRAAYRSILGQASSEAKIPTSGPVVPAQLPPDVHGFVGRRGELAHLEAVTAAVASRPVVLITGTAGVGKTALAVRWAHRVADRHPDGQLYLDLRGFSGGSAMAPEEALQVLLAALGVAPTQIPVGLDQQIGLYRSLFRGRRILLVLDNARDADQVRPLLPTAPGSLAVVTSRSELTGLVALDGAHPLRLDVLAAEEAYDLLAARLSAIRLATEPVATQQIIGRCARLPLALAIVAARAAVRTDLRLAVMADELAREEGPLDVLDGGDPRSNVRTMFAWSYRSLTTTAARLFRLFGVHPATGVSTDAIASLVGVPVREIRVPLAELVRANLLTPMAADRYTTHDLLRGYAAELARTEESDDTRQDALCRLVEHYVHSALAAAELLETARIPIQLDQPGPGVSVAVLADREDGLAWFIREHGAFMSVLTQAADAGLHAQTWLLAIALAGYLDNQGHWADWVAAARLALDAARQLADRDAEARANHILARGYAQVGAYAEAEKHYQEALTIFENSGDETGQAGTHFGLSWMAELREQYEDALHHSQRALCLYRAAGNLVGEARALNSMGWTHALRGEYAQTLEYCQRALDLQQGLGDEDGQAATWDSIGYAHHRLGSAREATKCYERALELYRRCGDRLNEAEVLDHLGEALQATDDLDAAATVWHEAAEILAGLGHDDVAAVRSKLAAIGRG